MTRKIFMCEMDYEDIYVSSKNLDQIIQFIFITYRRMPISRIQILSQIADFSLYLMVMVASNALNFVRNSLKLNLKNSQSFKRART